jgi:hypothetical protein
MTPQQEIDAALERLDGSEVRIHKNKGEASPEMIYRGRGSPLAALIRALGNLEDAITPFRGSIVRTVYREDLEAVESALMALVRAVNGGGK